MVPVAPASRSAISVIGFLAVEGAFYRIAAGLDEVAQLGRRTRHFDLEVAHERNLAGEPNEKGRRERNAAQGRILYHNRDSGRFRNPRKMLRHPVLVRAQAGAVIRRHQHQHAGAAFGCLAGTLGGDPGTEVTGGDDDRHTVGHMSETEARQCVALLVSQKKLLGVIRQDADAIDALIDHAIEHTTLTFEIKVAVLQERGRRNWEHPLVGTLRERGHGVLRIECGSMIVARHRSTALADKEIKVGALVSLKHVIDVQLHVATVAVACRGLPSSPAAVDLGAVNM